MNIYTNTLLMIVPFINIKLLFMSSNTFYFNIILSDYMYILIYIYYLHIVILLAYLQPMCVFEYSVHFINETHLDLILFKNLFWKSHSLKWSV